MPSLLGRRHSASSRDELLDCKSAQYAIISMIILALLLDMLGHVIFSVRTLIDLLIILALLIDFLVDVAIDVLVKKDVLSSPCVRS